MSALVDVFSRARQVASRNAFTLSAGAALWALCGAVALLVPLGDRAPGTETSEPTAVQASADHQPENLSTFLTSERWGVSLAEIQRQQALEAGGAEGAADPTELGYLGFAAREDSATVLIRLPDGTVQERKLGDKLPDGRELSALGDTELIVTSEDQPEEELLLFPDLSDYNDVDEDVENVASEQEAPP